MDKVDSFKNRLQQAIDDANLQQIEVSRLSGISKSLLNKYLKGISEAGNKKLYALANALNVSPVWLLGYDVPKNDLDKLKKDSSKIDKLTKFITNLSEEDFNKLIILLKTVFNYEDSS